MIERSRHKPKRRPASKRPGQPGGVRDTNRIKKRQHLLDTALVLFLERGVESVSVDEITTAAGVAKGSFYRYFNDQKSLVAELVAPVRALMLGAFEEVSRALDGVTSREKQFGAYRAIGDVLGSLIMGHPGVVRLYLQESRGPGVGVREPLVSLAKDVTARSIALSYKAQALRLFRPFPVEVSALTVIGASERLMLGVLREEEVGNPLELPGAVVSLIIDGLGLKSAPAAGRGGRAGRD
jgi:AcrR family transcriptional regulator